MFSECNLLLFLCPPLSCRSDSTRKLEMSELLTEIRREVSFEGYSSLFSISCIYSSELHTCLLQFVEYHDGIARQVIITSRCPISFISSTFLFASKLDKSDLCDSL
ncbi:unnamed protein product [Amoebophrya sp. A25]|nr:unnamed protein product [Amoebophrya sp. A25]|eukprot:GSA25T00008170001.1